LTEDFYRRAIRRDATPREVVLVGRMCVLAISLIALILALGVKTETILEIVAYAWGGFGAAFGPLVLFALFSKQTSWPAALAGMISGTITLVLWKQVGLSERMYEIVPGFVANCAAIAVVNRLIRQSDKVVLQQFDEVVAQLRKGTS
jgi:sodium/proline symporter